MAVTVRRVRSEVQDISGTMVSKGGENNRHFYHKLRRYGVSARLRGVSGVDADLDS